MRPWAKALLPLLACLAACGPATQKQSASAPALADGEGVVLSFSRRSATWVVIRSTAESRTNGWKERCDRPVLVVYGGRGFNPVFTNLERVRVEWLDGDRVVRIEEAQSGARHLSPNQEVTAALVVPEGCETGLRVGDQVLLVGGR